MHTNTHVFNLFERCRELDIRLSVHEDSLRCDSPGGLPPDLRAALVAWKSDIIAHLTKSTETPQSAGELPAQSGVAAAQSGAPSAQLGPPWECRLDPYVSAERATIQAEEPLITIADVRQVLPSWPIPWREAWGRRANELMDQGIHHPNDSIQAFLEVRKRYYAQYLDDKH